MKNGLKPQPVDSAAVAGVAGATAGATAVPTEQSYFVVCYYDDNAALLRIEEMIKRGELKVAPPEDSHDRVFKRIRVIGSPALCEQIDGVGIIRWRSLSQN